MGAKKLILWFYVLALFAVVALLWFRFFKISISRSQENRPTNSLSRVFKKFGAVNKDFSEIKNSWGRLEQKLSETALSEAPTDRFEITDWPKYQAQGFGFNYPPSWQLSESADREIVFTKKESLSVSFKQLPGQGLVQSWLAINQAGQEQGRRYIYTDWLLSEDRLGAKILISQPSGPDYQEMRLLPLDGSLLTIEFKLTGLDDNQTDLADFEQLLKSLTFEAY